MRTPRGTWELMSTQTDTEEIQQERVPIKLAEPDVDPQQPWSDDLLGRKQVAGRLTSLIRHQRVPFVMSIDGYWGTGKTFLLKRWQRELEDKGFQSIYFNAWEDDFCDDPLVAIIGQLSDHFKDGKFREAVGKIRDNAGPLLRQNVSGVLKKHTGLTFVIEDAEEDPLDVYTDQRATKDEVKRQLAELSSQVHEDTGKPVVFIIDELDRCRPTFAIELLERVKHIFDVPNMVFVFGINRSELCSSLQSIYGEIDADIYLRRFFDMEFALPDVETETFCKHLMDRFELRALFASLAESARSPIHHREFGEIYNGIPAFWSRFELSLRDLDYCVRSVALVGRSLQPRYPVHPWLLGLLIPLKIKNNHLYRQFITGRSLPSEVVNYVDDIVGAQSLTRGQMDGNIVWTLDAMEALLYRTERRPYGQPAEALNQLELLCTGADLTSPDYLSRRTQAADERRANNLKGIMSRSERPDISFTTVEYTANLIDLHMEMVRR